MPSFHQRRKSEQQSRMMQPTILNIKASKKNKNKIMIVDICLKQKLRWVGDIALLKNNKRFDRKGGKFSQKWLRPYTVMNITDKGVCTFKKTRRK